MDINEESSTSELSKKVSRKWEFLAFTAAVVVLISPLFYLLRVDHDIKIPVVEESQFVGSKKCESCHQEVYKKWLGSDHDLAMDEATDTTVLGDFSGITYTDPYTDLTSRFFMENEKFYVETDGPDGKPGVFEITYVFGVHPLQQYLVPFPGGRLQCLNIAWDVENKVWYRLPPYDVEDHNDWLHWTKGSQTWNSMCAECHSTRLKKAYSMETQSFDTSWFEIDVGCEACHGAGSNHVDWAKKPVMGRSNTANFGLDVQTGSGDNKKQIAICAPCHARRYQLGDNDHKEGELLDKMVPTLLTEGLYYPDGQILDEVYVYGSFTQSKMYNNGVQCSDCHDMHSMALHKKGNDLCTQCHRAGDYDSQSHHFHKREYKGKPSEGYLCVKCHMPGRVYMGIDYRPDHSLRIPRPDLTPKIGTPNSCSTSGCHNDKSNEWVLESYTKWYGVSRKPHYGETIAAARKGLAEAEKPLMALAEDSLQPVIVRATALTLLSTYTPENTRPVFTRALEDIEPLIRATAIRHLINLSNADLVRLIEPKLYDKVKAVRIEAAAILVKVPEELLKPDDRETFKKVLEEYRIAMEYNSDFAAQRYNLGNLEASLHNDELAAEHFKESIAIDDKFYPAKVNWAMQLNSNGQNDEAVKLFKEVLKDHPTLYDVSYSLGLLLAEMNNYKEASTYLQLAAIGMPNNSRAQYNFALSLLKMERWQEGEDALLVCLEIDPESREYFNTLANLYLSFRMGDKAKALARKMLEMNPDHEQAKQLLNVVK